MIAKLDRKDYEKVRSLFTELSEYNAAIPALLDGINGGWVLVDSVDRPTAAFAKTVEGYALAGDSENDSFVAAVNAYLKENIFNDEHTVNGDGVYMNFHPKNWESKVASLFHPREPMTLIGRHYLCSELKYTDWREHLPDGFSVHQIDDSLLDKPGLIIPDNIIEWISGNWGTRQHYLEYGFGFCVVHNDAISHWSIADCATKDGNCEIGIWSTTDHRRKGLAAIAAAAAVEYALSNGFNRVGWHCVDDNVGSYKTAEKVGFLHKRTRENRYCMVSSVHQIAENGWFHGRNGRSEAATKAYTQLFAISDDYPHYIYHTAAEAYANVGKKDQAISCLNMAVDRDWSRLDYTKSREQFRILHDMSQWDAVLARMKEKK